MQSAKNLYKKGIERLTDYVGLPGDDPDTVLQKKIWWLLNLGSVPVLLISVFLMGTRLGTMVFYTNLVFLSSMAVPLVLFHFHRKNIEGYALFSQLAIVLLTSLKVYLMGGMLHTGTPVYVGFIAPVYALILPNKQRALYIFSLFTILMITATLLNPFGPEDYLFYKYFLGFLISMTSIFFTLYYFTTQWEKGKERERDQLRNLDNLKTRFYTHIAHEFRTPLMLISGMSDKVLEAPERWLEEGHETIQRNSRSLLRLTDQLLDLAKLEDRAMPLNLIQDDIVYYLRYLVESFHSAAKSREIRLSFKAEPNVMIVDFDPDKIREVMSNLLGNALKFTPKSGAIRVSLKSAPVEEGNRFCLSVRDTGIGISREELPRIFNRYFQAENQLQYNSAGSGLGLALTRELVHLMGGEIRVESQPGKGSVFEVTLPIHREAPPTRIAFENVLPPGGGVTSSKGAKVPMGGNSKALRLLIVEDNPDVVRYLSGVLEGEYRISIAENGLEGYEKALEEIPDLVISDVMMPVMDGFTLCRKLKGDIRTSHIPVVLLTARSDTDSRLRGLETGADAYLSKPFDRKELKIRIDRLIALRKKLQVRYRHRAAGEDQPIDERNREPHGEDSFMVRVKDILMAHLDEDDFGVQQLCSSLGMSRSQLDRKFSALTDTTVNQYLMNLRLNKARRLLQTTNLNVSEVAYDTGFKNPSHFSRAFSKRYGYAPGKFRIRNPISV
jgi:signal transduction histidine kinase/AraC-like DNA-binding protein